jgi:PIN domain nuclease of toxin-antitoxin system
LTVLIDSWAWIEFFQGTKAGEVVSGHIDSDQDLIISAINLAEVYCWILLYYDESVAEDKKCAMMDRCTLINVEVDIAVDAARIRHTLKWGLGDSIVYATAKREGAKVLTGESDFRGKEGVLFIDRP